MHELRGLFPGLDLYYIDHPAHHFRTAGHDLHNLSVEDLSVDDISVDDLSVDDLSDV